MKCPKCAKEVFELHQAGTCLDCVWTAVQPSLRKTQQEILDSVGTPFPECFISGNHPMLDHCVTGKEDLKILTDFLMPKKGGVEIELVGPGCKKMPRRWMRVRFKTPTGFGGASLDFSCS